MAGLGEGKDGKKAAQPSEAEQPVMEQDEEGEGMEEEGVVSGGLDAEEEEELARLLQGEEELEGVRHVTERRERLRLDCGVLCLMLDGGADLLFMLCVLSLIACVVRGAVCGGGGPWSTLMCHRAHRGGGRA
jgi:hypothetical protein